MWIVPKQLISAYVPDMEALSLDCVEQSQLCAQSLFVRSKLSQSRTWSQKWKRDSWTQHLSGRILKPSHGKAFEIAWTSSLAVIPVSRSAQQESEQEKAILDIFGPSSQAEFDFFDQGSVSLKTLKDISLWGCPTSSKTWQEWVTEQRGAYSLRLKSAHPTNGSGSLSWLTSTTRDYKRAYRPESMIRSDGKSRAMDTLNQAMVTVASWPTPTVAEAGKISNQPNYGQVGLSNHSAIQGEVTRDKYEKRKNGHPAQENPSMSGNHLGLWHTPTQAPEAPNTNSRRAVREGRQPKGQQHSLLAQAQQSWPTPTARDYKSGRGNEEREYKELTPMVERTQNGKLNPRWVETLMGLPIGWTMPSCSQPVTIELTNSDFLETELCQQQQKELFEC
jgi:hypothetical protein